MYEFFGASVFNIMVIIATADSDSISLTDAQIDKTSRTFMDALYQRVGRLSM